MSSFVNTKPDHLLQQITEVFEDSSYPFISFFSWLRGSSLTSSENEKQEVALSYTKPNSRNVVSLSLEAQGGTAIHPQKERIQNFSASPKYPDSEQCHALDSYFRQVIDDDNAVEKTGFDSAIERFISTSRTQPGRRVRAANDRKDSFAEPSIVKYETISSKRTNGGQFDEDLLFDPPDFNLHGICIIKESLPSNPIMPPPKFHTHEVMFALGKDGTSIKTEMLGPPLIPASEMSYADKKALWWQSNDFARFREKANNLPPCLRNGFNIFNTSKAQASYRVSVVSSPHATSSSLDTIFDIFATW